MTRSLTTLDEVVAALDLAGVPFFVKPRRAEQFLRDEGYVLRSAQALLIALQLRIDRDVDPDDDEMTVVQAHDLVLDEAGTPDGIGYGRRC